MNNTPTNDRGFQHIPVLLHEVIENLNIEKGKSYIDATAGGGGHTSEIIKNGGTVLAIDQDDEALRHLSKKFEGQDAVKIVKGNFGDIEAIARLHGFGNSSGVLFDLGMSSYQIDSSVRGFSFHRDQPLDMRMDEQNTRTAYEIINSWSPDQLEEIFQRYGEEQQARQVAEQIVLVRKEKKIETTGELVKIIKKVIHRNEKIHPATRVFQALRIAVNEELEMLKQGLRGALNITESNGRVLVISFHSLEDRIVKNTFRDWEKQNLGNIENKKPILAGDEELTKNPRSRSAKLRIFTKK